MPRVLVDPRLKRSGVKREKIAGRVKSPYDAFGELIWGHLSTFGGSSGRITTRHGAV